MLLNERIPFAVWTVRIRGVRPGPPRTMPQRSLRYARLSRCPIVGMPALTVAADPIDPAIEDDAPNPPQLADGARRLSEDPVTVRPRLPKLLPEALDHGSHHGLVHLHVEEQPVGGAPVPKRLVRRERRGCEENGAARKLERISVPVEHRDLLVHVAPDRVVGRRVRQRHRIPTDLLPRGLDLRAERRGE